jgi:phosphopantothenoylcysteine decarboxylase/phosphopantothenate--cysteine ligase
VSKPENASRQAPTKRDQAAARQPGTDPERLAGYEVLVGIGGGIAAYKTCQLVSQLVQQGCGVTVAMSEAGTRFVTPLTFQTLTHRRVFTSMWQSQADYDPRHLTLTDAADLFLVAPATADLIAKFAAALADDLLSTLMVACDGPAVLAPAMNTRMWENPIVQANLRRLGKFGFHLIEPGRGKLACGTVGPGRMAEPATILDTVERLLRARKPKQNR